ncbi:longitudinals lacking protein, isoforms A/B/D/L-like [Thrips palmi]|uniref:Longitudinals lacking protein, isoforms A/B/D/L-like n=1 Tax=Thrips palmi TaxID=161013 RepID=A0A6P8ZY22_THRPL|nr:longitudinals lacking protein, isoforms A/B/D/L-like [Thrips palmi]
MCSVRPAGTLAHHISEDTNTSLEFRGEFSCPRCGKDYRWKRNLTRHLSKECGKEPAFQCHSCDYRSKHKQHMLRHIASRHAEQDPLM